MIFHRINQKASKENLITNPERHYESIAFLVTFFIFRNMVDQLLVFVFLYWFGLLPRVEVLEITVLTVAL